MAVCHWPGITAIRLNGGDVFKFSLNRVRSRVVTASAPAAIYRIDSKFRLKQLEHRCSSSVFRG